MNETATGYRQLLQETRQSNRKEAERSLSSAGPPLQAAYLEVLELQSKLKLETDRYRTLLDSKTRRFGKTKEGILAEIRQQVERLEHETDGYSSELLLGTRDISSFLSDYIDKRTQYHALLHKMKCSR
jgi:Modifier of rudimentary (Mod(r)) protein